jgi:hypothetical protein
MNIQHNPNISGLRPSLRSASVAQPQKQAGLSGDEKQLIGRQFKAASPRVLELYASNGESRVEQPQAKGRNIDFRV